MTTQVFRRNLDDGLVWENLGYTGVNMLRQKMVVCLSITGDWGLLLEKWLSKGRSKGEGAPHI